MVFKELFPSKAIYSAKANPNTSNKIDDKKTQTLKQATKTRILLTSPYRLKKKLKLWYLSFIHLRRQSATEATLTTGARNQTEKQQNKSGNLDLKWISQVQILTHAGQPTRKYCRTVDPKVSMCKRNSKNTKQLRRVDIQAWTLKLKKDEVENKHANLSEWKIFSQVTLLDLNIDALTHDLRAELPLHKIKWMSVLAHW